MAFRIFSVFVLLTLITSVGRVEAQALGNVDTQREEDPMIRRPANLALERTAESEAPLVMLRR